MPIKQEQDFVDALGGSDILNKIIEHNSQINQIKLTNSINNVDLLKVNNEKRKYKEEQWTQQRTMRSIIEMPPEVALQVERMEPGFFKDKKIMKAALEKDPFLQQYLTVPLNSI